MLEMLTFSSINIDILSADIHYFTSQMVRRNEHNNNNNIKGIIPTTSDDYIPNFLPCFAGFTCYFLKEEKYRVLEFFSSNVVLTRKNDLRVSIMSEVMVNQLIKNVHEVLVPIASLYENILIRNLFQRGVVKPVYYLKFSQATTFTTKNNNDGDTTVMKENPMEPGKRYHARISLVLKGAKIDRNLTIVSPMMKVKEVMFPTSLLNDKISQVMDREVDNSKDYEFIHQPDICSHSLWLSADVTNLQEYFGFGSGFLCPQCQVYVST